MPKDNKKTPEARSEERAKNYPNLRPRPEREGRVIVTAPSRDTLESAESALERVTSAENPRIRRAVKINSLRGPPEDVSRGPPDNVSGGPPEYVAGGPPGDLIPTENLAVDPNVNVTTGSEEVLPIGPSEKQKSGPLETIPSRPSEDLPGDSSENLETNPEEILASDPTPDLPGVPPKVDDASNNAPCEGNVDEEGTDKKNFTEVPHDSTRHATPESANSTAKNSSANQPLVTPAPPNLATEKSIVNKSEDYDEMMALAEAVASTEKASDSKSKDEGSTMTQPKAEEAP